MTYTATAVLSPLGARIDWHDNTPGPAEASIIGLVDELRARAIRTPTGVATARIENMDTRAQYAHDAVTILSVDNLGTPAFTADTTPATPPADANIPQQLTTTPAAPSAIPAPIEPTMSWPSTPAAATPAPAAAEPAASPLFGQTFTSIPTGTVASLPSVTIATANTKGGAGKTTLAITVMLAAAALAGHNDLVLVDTNPSGNLAEHTSRTSPHDVLQLAHAAATTPDFGARNQDLAPYLSWQPEGWATIVCPTSIVAGEGGLLTDLAGDDITRILAALHQQHQLVLIDTGNNAKDPAWQAAISAADRILVPVQWDPDTIIEAQKMITDMHAVGHPDLKHRILFVGTHHPGTPPDKKRARHYRHALETSGWTVMDLAPDRHIARGEHITWNRLSRRTRTDATKLVKALLP